MPGLDRTGPRGQGSRTGRQMGKCNPENKNQNNFGSASEPGDNERSFFGNGSGFRRKGGRGRGQGRGRLFGN